MSTVPRNVKILGFTPGLHGSAAAESTTIDTGVGEARDVYNVGPDPLHVHPVELTDDGHALGTPIEVIPGGHAVVKGLSKLSSPGEATVTISGTRPA